ncbi:MAG: hypothetical protein EBV03_04445 [Proteobacteria bacterium]|nr:hypothetical protein [Pseudomonadota bacterium]
MHDIIPLPSGCALNDIITGYDLLNPEKRALPINVILSGDELSITRAIRQVAQYNAKGEYHIDTEIVSRLRPALDPDTGRPEHQKLRLNIVNGPAPLNAEEALQLAHRVTGCQLGVRLRAELSKKDGRYAPVAVLDIQQPNPQLHALVTSHMVSHLKKILHSRLVLGRVGAIGMPEELEQIQAMPEGPQQYPPRSISMTFHEIANSSRNSAQRLAYGIAEHLSGLLGLPECSTNMRRTGS